MIVTGPALALPMRLRPTDIGLAGGELVCLVGPNGSGKTSLLHALAGIGRPEGEVRIAGEDLRRAAPARRAGLLAYLPASRDIVWPLRARDLVALGPGQAPRANAVDDALARLGAVELADRRVDRLSTGERSRVLIARVLAAGAKLILLDEPTANLDPLWQLRLMEHLRVLARDEGRAVFAAMHDLEMARIYADRLVLMHQGAILADGDPESLLAGEHVREAFGIERHDGRWQPISPPADPRSSR
jgi:iron complex transport system ATP-binding protein